jgi:hypothetical protein
MWRLNINIKDRSVVAAAVGFAVLVLSSDAGGLCAAILHNRSYVSKIHNHSASVPLKVSFANITSIM